MTKNVPELEILKEKIGHYTDTKAAKNMIRGMKLYSKVFKRFGASKGHEISLDESKMEKTFLCNFCDHTTKKADKMNEHITLHVLGKYNSPQRYTESRNLFIEL